MKNTEILFDGHLTGRPFRRIRFRYNKSHFSMLGNYGLFDCCLTGQPQTQAVEKRVMELLREVTE